MVVRPGNASILTIHILMGNKTIEAPVNDCGLTQIGQALDRHAKVGPDLAQVVDFKFSSLGYRSSKFPAMQRPVRVKVRRKCEKAQIRLYCELHT